MDNEYMPEYHPISAHALAAGCARAKWSLVAMALFCFAWSVFTFCTQPLGGNGFLMITPVDGPVGLARMLPVCLAVFGALASVLAMASRTAWALGWVEPALGFIMLVLGLFWMYDGAGTFSQVYTIAGILIALYLMAVALEMYRRDMRYWSVGLAFAVATWVVAMALGVNAAAAPALLPMAALEFFVAALGFTYGAARLAGTSEED